MFLLVIQIILLCDYFPYFTLKDTYLTLKYVYVGILQRGNCKQPDLSLIQLNFIFQTDNIL